MTITHRKRPLPDETQVVVNEPGLQVECDGCRSDLTHSVRIKCADPACEGGEGVDICPRCYTQGKEFGQHKRTHAYRIIELHSYPIFDQDWGADEELLLNEGLTLQGLGNWAAVAEHVGTRTKEEVEQHYNSVYIDSPNYPLPRMDKPFNIATSDFQARKRRRIESLSNSVAAAAVAPKPAPTSAPGVHEVATYLPGRLEFEHEIDNDAEDTVKDLEFGTVFAYGGDEMPEDENDNDVKARKRWAEARTGLDKGKRKRTESVSGAPPLGKPIVNGINGHGHKVINGYVKPKVKSEDGNTRDTSETGTGADGDAIADDSTAPLLPIETEASIGFKLSLLDMYHQRVAKRHETKAFIFERGLLEYKKLQAADKKRPKEEREFVHKFRPYAKLQTAQDYEEFVNGMLYESMLRRRIQELQHYRRLGLTSSADIEKYENELHQRNAKKTNPGLQRDQSSDRLGHLHRQGSRASFPPDYQPGSGDSEGRRSRDPDVPAKVGPSGRKPVAPLNLANAPSLHLLTAPEQTLCSQLRILPKAYLVIKETLVREFARRGGKLRRREARELVKIDVNKTSRVWDYLVQAGVLRMPDEPPMSGAGSIGVPPSGTTAAPATSPSKTPLLPPSQSDPLLIGKDPSLPPPPYSAPPLATKRPPPSYPSGI